MEPLKAFSLDHVIKDSFNEVEVELKEYDTDNFGFLSLQRNAYIQLADASVNEIPKYNSSLLSIGNKNGYYVSGIPLGFVFGRTESLRESLKSKAVKGIVEHRPLLTIHLEKKVLNLSFSSDEQYLIVATEENIIMFYNTQKLLQKNNYHQPEFVFQIENIKNILPNPVDNNIVAVLTFFGNIHMINFSQRNISKPLANNITSCKFMVSKRQTNNGSLKAVINKPKSLNDAYYVSSILWLENHVFFVVYNDYNLSENLRHDYIIFIITREQNGTIVYGKLVDPSPPFGLTSRIDHHFIKYFKNWEPNLKDFIIIAATASTDIGIVCRNKDDLVWKTLIISNETYRASLPYSLLNDCDTSPIGIALDFTLSENIQKPLFPNDEPKESQPLPILYLLNNDYFLTGYYVLYIDAIKAGKICSSMCLAKENIPDINFNQNTAVATKECSFGFTPLHMPNLPTLNSKSMSEKTSDSHTFRQMINNSISFGVSSFGVPSFGIPVFGNTSFGSSANTGTENLVFKKKEFGSTSQGIKSSFASFASMTKSNNDSPFGNLIQNSSQMYGNKSENIFSESKSSFSFNTSRPENKDDDIEDDELQIENDNALEDRIECISDKEPKIISDSPFGGIMNFFNINNEKKDSTNIQSQQFNSSESSVETSNLCLFERENNLSVDNMSVKSSNLSFSAMQDQKSSDFFLIQKSQIRNNLENSNMNILSSDNSRVSCLSEINDIIKTEKASTDLLKKEDNSISFSNLSFNETDELSEKLKKINKNTQISFDEVTPPIILNKFHRNIFEAKIYDKTELNRDYESRISDYDFDSLNSEKKKELSSLEHSCPEITPLSKGNVLGNNLNVSLNESIICDSVEKSVFQNVLKFHENLPVNVSKVKSNDLLPYISPESENIGFEENGHLISQNSNILSNMPLISSHNLNVLEPKSDTEVLSNFSKIETLNTTNEIYNHEIKKSILFKEQHTMKLMPLVSMSEVSKAQSKEKGLIKEIDIIYIQMESELNVIQENLWRLSQFIEIQKNNNIQDHIDLSVKQIKKWKLSEISQMEKKACILLSDVSNFQKIENMNLNVIKFLKKTFIKLEAKHIEVSRFIRARIDHEFTQMIKVRQLGFEHLESQAKLRKICQNVEDYLWKAEEDFALYKAKLAGRTNGNIKMPSLESIKKALGKIGSLIQQSMNEVNNLEFHFKELKTESFIKAKDIKVRTSRKNLFFSENISSITTTDILRKDKFLTILKEIMKKRCPLHTTICD
ncbi:unnamed protein product [Pneumocystis jirovecii]|uniref:Nucleoporin Nup159/Nup146 N-terminal domain-containing protein n=1 Tax=Pneumocystis jirovecii TaxID=42068 RepID=L0PAH4_PNEJI|nr:unnamed protein product [Pneumocystis jirovecii]